MDSHVDKLESDLKSGLNNTVLKIKREMQQELYEYIDAKVGNKDFKLKLKQVMEESKEPLDAKLKESVSIIMERFKQNLENTIRKFKDRVEEIKQVQAKFAVEHSSDWSFIDLMDIRNFAKGKVTELIFSTMGVGFSVVWAITATGLGAIVVGVIVLFSSLVVFAKNVLGFLRPKYRMSQQREKADQVLSKFEMELKEHINKKAAETHYEVKKQVVELKNMVLQATINAKKVKMLIEQANTRLKKLQKSPQFEEVWHKGV